MLKDGYVEQIVKASTPTGVFAGMGIGITVSILGIFSMSIFAWGILVVAIGIAVFFIEFSRRDTEYEYLMVNDEIEIARIIAKKSRKKECSFKNSRVKFIAKKDSIFVDNQIEELQSERGHMKFRNYTSKYGDNSENIYVFVINRKNMTEFVSLELTEKSIAHMNNFFKGKYKE